MQIIVDFWWHILGQTRILPGIKFVLIPGSIGVCFFRFDSVLVDFQWNIIIRAACRQGFAAVQDRAAARLNHPQ